MIYTDIGLCSQALLKIGAATISSFEDSSSEAEVAANLYPLLRDGLLSVYPWSFASAQCVLPRLTEMPVADYCYAYRLPPDLLRIVSAGIGERGQGLEYRIRENALHTNADKVVLSYLFRPAEKNFPAFFCDALVARLAAEFCLPLTESSSRAEYLAKKAEDELARARLTDSQQATPRRFEDFTLVEIRR